MSDLIYKNKPQKEKLVIFTEWLNGDTTVNITINDKTAVINFLANIDRLDGVVGLSILSVQDMTFGGWYLDSSKSPSFDFEKHFKENNLMDVDWITESKDNTLIIRE